MNDYRARKFKRKQEFLRRVWRRREEKFNDVTKWLGKEKREIRKWYWVHLAAVIAPAVYTLFFPPDPPDAWGMYLIGAVWGIIVYGHYQSTSDSKNYNRWLRWHEQQLRDHPTLQEKLLDWEGARYRVKYEGVLPVSAVRVTDEGEFPVGEQLLTTLDMMGMPVD